MLLFSLQFSFQSDVKMQSTKTDYPPKLSYISLNIGIDHCLDSTLNRTFQQILLSLRDSALPNHCLLTYVVFDRKEKIKLFKKVWKKSFKNLCTKLMESVSLEFMFI